MAQRRNRPTRPGTASLLPLVLATILLVIVIVLVGVLILNTRGGDSQEVTPTVAATTTPTTTSQATPSPAPASPTAAAEASPPPASPEPTEEPTEAPTPTPTPLVGEFGPLPAGQMPSGNSTGRPLNFEYHLDMSLQMVPAQAPAYEMQARIWTAEQVQDLADSLGITGEVVDQGGGSFRVTGTGSLYVSGNLVQYVSPQEATPVAAMLPPDDMLTEAARSWLVGHQIVGADAGQGTVLDRDEETGQAHVLIKPVEPQQIFSAIPSALITVRADTSVSNAEVHWPAGLRRSDYGLRTAEEMWADVTSGRGYIEIDPTQLPQGGGPIQGTVTATSASLAYTIAGNPATGQFLVPLVVFSGQAQIEGVEAPIPVQIYVQAVSAQAAPRG